MLLTIIVVRFTLVVVIVVLIVDFGKMEKLIANLGKKCFYAVLVALSFLPVTINFKRNWFFSKLRLNPRLKEGGK